MIGDQLDPAEEGEEEEGLREGEGEGEGQEADPAPETEEWPGAANHYLPPQPRRESFLGELMFFFVQDEFFP